MTIEGGAAGKAARVFKSLRGFLAPPAFLDDEQTRIARLLNVISFAILVLFVLSGVSVPFVTATPVPPLMSVSIGIVMQIGVIGLMRRGHLRSASVLLASVLWGIVTFSSAFFGGIGGPVPAGYTIVILIAGLLLGGVAAVVFAGLSIAAGLAILYSGGNALLPWQAYPVTPPSAWVTQAAVLVGVALLLNLALRNLGAAMERARAGENAQAEANRELERLRASLAQAVEARTAELAHERNLLRILIDALPDYIYVKDAQARFILANATVTRHMGAASASELIGKSDRDFYPPELADKFYLDDMAVLQSGQPLVGVEEPTVDTAGEWTWTLTTKVPFLGSDGQVAGLVGLGRDITRQKQIDKELETERNTLRTLLDNLPDAVFVKDRDGRFVVSNAANAEFFGVDPPDAILGKTLFEILPADRAQLYGTNDKQVLENGECFVNYEKPKPVSRPGRNDWTLVTKVPLRDSSGSITGLVVISRDITERKQAEETLRLQATRLQTAAEVARAVSSILDVDRVLPRVVDLIRERFGYYHVAVFLNEPDGIRTTLWASSNAAAGHAFERDVQLRIGEEGIVGSVARSGQWHVAPDVGADALYLPHPLVPATLSEVAIPLKVEERVIGVLDVQSQALDDFGPDAVAMLATIADQISVAIQNARLHSAEMQRAQELERAYMALKDNQAQLLLSEKMASLGRLTAGIAHEMNTPLAAVRAALVEVEKLTAEYQASLGDPQVTSDDYREILEEMQHSISLAVTASERAASFVRSIKSQTRDMSSAKRQPFNAVAVIDEALLLLRHALRKSNCTVSFERPKDAMDLFGLPGRLAEIITNLVTNAIDASAGAGGGAITVRLETTADGLDLVVGDQGAGIAPEILPKIFDPMFTTKPFGEGTGLGLAIVRDIVVGEFGGTVEVDSRTGAGTTFTIHLPKVAETTHAA